MLKYSLTGFSEFLIEINIHINSFSTIGCSINFFILNMILLQVSEDHINHIYG